MTGVRKSYGIRVLAVLTLNSQYDFVAIREVVHPDFGYFEQSAAINVSLPPFFTCEFDFFCVDQGGNSKEGKGVASHAETRSAQTSFAGRR